MGPSPAPVPVLGFCAYSGTGKTTLLSRLIPRLREEGLRLALVKHAHHSFDIDHPGKDSYALRKAGADQVLIASRRRIAYIKERGLSSQEPHLRDILPCIDCQGLDLILAEGFKHEAIPKVELYRPSLGKPMLHPADRDVIAVASDEPFTLARDLPCLDLNAPEEIACFILEWLRDRAAGSAPTRPVEGAAS
ncbi:MAG: molybdopterin-guanine dinucleotide biosynthesis protein B [Chromatiaceae bacterium]|jgi:molybdopterin-guanine dinucleotide biosynthesis protein MobB